ncbi:uncharacterized protein LOC128244972 [Mya arenaria]|uniref:uncharacterized protein LOC128244972 n=1 Tax=Mya arenaria TaxID=6604 RepID=UPI0022E11409|nr:uncharacterized protein LOC128244972 [Mya arenaria]
MSSSTKKARRKENWCQEEAEILRKSYVEFSSELGGNLSLTSAVKQKTWKCIQERVNSQGIGPCKRSIEDCKRKLKTDFKRRQRRSRQRAAIKSGGPKPPKEECDDMMINSIGDSATDGFPIIDTFEFRTSESSSREPSYSAEPDQPFSHNIAETIKVMTECVLPLASMQIESLIGDQSTTPTDNRDERFSEIPSTSNLERLLQHQNELLEQILHQQKMKNDILLYISDNLNCDSASVPQHHTL